jgi:hypothetical protein
MPLQILFRLLVGIFSLFLCFSSDGAMAGGRPSRFSSPSELNRISHLRSTCLIRSTPAQTWPTGIQFYSSSAGDRNGTIPTEKVLDQVESLARDLRKELDCFSEESVGAAEVFQQFRDLLDRSEELANQANSLFKAGMVRRKVEPLSSTALETLLSLKAYLHETGQSSVLGNRIERDLLLSSGNWSGRSADQIMSRVLDDLKGKKRMIAVMPNQLIKKFKHAVDFGIAGALNSKNLYLFKRAIESHVSDPTVYSMEGSFRGMSVIHYVHPKTGINVIKDRDGAFISGWKLNPLQLKSVLKSQQLGQISEFQ